MGWQDQGRQYQGYSGDGTGQAAPSEAAARDQRIEAVARGAIGALPPELRTRAAALLDPHGLSQLTELMNAWNRAAKLDDGTFAERFLGRKAGDPAVRQLRDAARAADLADSQADLRDAAIRLAGHRSWPTHMIACTIRQVSPRPRTARRTMTRCRMPYGLSMAWRT